MIDMSRRLMNHYSDARRAGRRWISTDVTINEEQPDTSGDVQGCLSDSKPERRTWNDPWVTQVENIWHKLVCVIVYVLELADDGLQGLPVTAADAIMSVVSDLLTCDLL